MRTGRLFAMCTLLLVGCVADEIAPPEADELATTEEAVVTSTKTEDVSATAAECHGFVTCPNVVWCSDWSGPEDCGGTYCRRTYCDGGWGYGTYQFHEWSRTCIDAGGNECVEYSPSFTGHLVACGC